MYSRIKAESQYIFNEVNDCAVIALSIGCDIPYERAHSVFKKFGRKNGEGVCFYDIRDAFEVVNFKLTPVSFKSKTIRSLEREFLKDGKRGTYLIDTATHVAIHKNNVTECWSKESLKRIINVYLVEK